MSKWKEINLIYWRFCVFNWLNISKIWNFQPTKKLLENASSFFILNQIWIIKDKFFLTFDFLIEILISKIPIGKYLIRFLKKWDSHCFIYSVYSNVHVEANYAFIKALKSRVSWISGYLFDQIILIQIDFASYKLICKICLVFRMIISEIEVKLGAICVWSNTWFWYKQINLGKYFKSLSKVHLRQLIIV